MNPIFLPTPIERNVPRSVFGRVRLALSRWIYARGFANDRKQTNKNRRLSLFFVFRTADISGLTCFEDLLAAKPVRITATYDDAAMAVEKFCYVDRYEHFSRWCEIRGWTPALTGNAWQQYKKDVLEDRAIDYSILQVAYRATDMAKWMEIYVGIDG